MNSSHISTHHMREEINKQLLLTLIPSSSLTLRIILTHISVILLKVGCSRQMSLRILITRFLTLIPVSCASNIVQLIQGHTMFCKHYIQIKAHIFIYRTFFCISRNSICLPTGGGIRLH